MIPAWSMWALVAVTGLACLTLMAMVVGLIFRPSNAPDLSARPDPPRTAEWLEEIEWHFPARERPEPIEVAA
jgi:hypothetical protein